MFDILIKCKLCGKQEVIGYHPFWTNKNICNFHREKIIKNHRLWLDKLIKKGD